MKILFFTKLIFAMSILIATPLFIYAGSKDSTGMDGIFFDIGWRKPGAWTTWDKSQKHNYLKNIGLYPGKGNKYKGHIESDLTDYFTHLSTTQPINWANMTQSQRRIFVDSTLVAQKEAKVAEQKAKEATIAHAESERIAAEEALKNAAIEERAVAQRVVEEVTKRATILEQEQQKIREEAEKQSRQEVMVDKIRKVMYSLIAIGVAVAAIITSIRYRRDIKKLDK